MGGQRRLTYPAAFFACARNFAHRFLAACPILALAAAERTRFFTRVTSCSVDCPKAFAADCKPFKSCCNMVNCFFTFFSSRLIAASMPMNPPRSIRHSRAGKHKISEASTVHGYVSRTGWLLVVSILVSELREPADQ